MVCGQIGLNVNYFYSLTQRQLFNVVNGYRKKEDYLSRERWQISRKIMFAYMCKYMGENGKETDILTFPWEEIKLKKLTEEEMIFLIQEEEKAKAFFERWDERKLVGKA